MMTEITNMILRKDLIICLQLIVLVPLVEAIETEDQKQDLLSESIYSNTLNQSEDQLVSCLLVPSKDVEVGTPVDGVLAEVKVDRGDRVNSGQLLARLKSGVQQALVNYRSAQAKYGVRRMKRTEELQQKQLMSEQDLDDIFTEQELSELELRQSREELKLRKITSPIQGIIAERFRSEGDLVGPEKIFRIIQISPLFIEVVLPASQFGKAKQNQVWNIKLELINRSIKAKVKVVDSVVDPASSTFRVRLIYPNKNNEIPSGLRCSLE
ncbi:MAG: efflux RND transporter periplasmic adaptor subunit [Pseudomonadales bacterium]|nr:efflux RND transporter periplasmic adaptor subunit [Pseudomonadales bacterium]